LLAYVLLTSAEVMISIAAGHLFAAAVNLFIQNEDGRGALFPVFYVIDACCCCCTLFSG